MRKSLFNEFLDYLWVGTLLLLIGSVVFTIATGRSPLEALGVSPAAGTLGAIVLMSALVVVPRIYTWLRYQQKN